MALKKYNPTSPGQRNLVTVDRSDLYKGKPVKKLTQGLTKTGGRNNSGHITSWQKGGGHKRRYRMVDFKRTKRDIEGIVERIDMIQTGQRLLRLLVIPMVIRVTFWLHNGFPLVIRLFRLIGQMLNPAMPCHYHLFRLEQLFTTSS